MILIKKLKLNSYNFIKLKELEFIWKFKKYLKTPANLQKKEKVLDKLKGMKTLWNPNQTLKTSLLKVIHSDFYQLFLMKVVKKQINNPKIKS